LSPPARHHREYRIMFNGRATTGTFRRGVFNDLCVEDELVGFLVDVEAVASAEADHGS